MTTTITLPSGEKRTPFSKTQEEIKKVLKKTYFPRKSKKNLKLKAGDTVYMFLVGNSTVEKGVVEYYSFQRDMLIVDGFNCLNVSAHIEEGGCFGLDREKVLKVAKKYWKSEYKIHLEDAEYNLDTNLCQLEVIQKRIEEIYNTYPELKKEKK